MFWSKFAYSIFVPPGIFIVAIILLAIWATYKKIHKFFILILCFMALVIYITSIPVFALNLNNAIGHTYQRSLPPKDARTAVIVLAGGASIDETGHPFQPSVITMERLYAAVRLTKEDPSCAFIIMSGGNTFERPTKSAAAVMKDAAETMDCKAQIVLEDKSRNTDENLEYSAEIVKKLGVKHVVIVTSNSHIKRAMDFAYQYMPDDVKLYAYPSGGYENREIKLTPEMFLPDVQALSESCVAIKELIGGAVAKLTGV